MKAQYALEYLMVMAITLLIIVPTSYLFYNYVRQGSSDITYPQITEIGSKIIQSAESVYYSGEDSRIVLDINMPDKLTDVYLLDNTELVFQIETDMGTNEMVFFSSVNLTTDYCTGNKCSLGINNSGLVKVKLESVSGGSEVLLQKE